VTETKTRNRMRVLATLVVFMFGAITTRLWFLQVMASPHLRDQALQNEVRLVPIDPIRGQILDRNGKVLAGNRASTVVLVDKRAMGDRQDAVLGRLANVLQRPVQDLVQRLNSVKYLPFQPVPVAEDVSKEAIFYLQEHRDQFPGVSYEVDPIRWYPGKELAAQLLGYLGEISDKQLKERGFKGNYRPGEVIGQSGVESSYEHYLHGIDGTKEIQVNARGVVLDPDFNRQNATPGDNVVLSIDRNVQELAEDSLSEGIRLARRIHLRATGGAAIVMDPRNGQVLALASQPGYDPSIFYNGLSTQEAAGLFSAGVNNPLLDRATQGLYPPGSTIKTFMAAAALKDGILTEGSTLRCPPTYFLGGHTFHNWSPLNYGIISIPEALTISCDTFFYQLGFDFWIQYARSGKRVEPMQRDLRQMGFGRSTGIDLPGEQAGLIPTPEYLRRVFASNPKVYGHFYGWLPGDAVSLAIGQGFIQVTPMQLAVAYSAIANGGTLWEPRVGMAVKDPATGRILTRFRSRVIGKLPLSRQRVIFLRDALKGVIERGTASFAFIGFPQDKIPVAGKTGTADIPPKQPVSWFAAMAPADHPRYVVVAMVEQGGHGATTAAPIVRRILEGLFGLHPTHLQAGQVVD
jgi:penicillin-binding protein 2